MNLGMASLNFGLWLTVDVVNIHTGKETGSGKGGFFDNLFCLHEFLD